MPEEKKKDDFLGRAIDGDQDAFSKLYEEYVGRIYNYV